MNKKILIVDDSAWIRKVLKTHLTNWGYEVMEAEDGQQALEQLDTDHFDLVICDVIMPKKTGWEVLNEVKSNPKTQDIPIIMLTAKNEDSDMFQGYQMGANYYMTKPFTKAQLIYGVRLMLGDVPKESQV